MGVHYSQKILKEGLSRRGYRTTKISLLEDDMPLEDDEDMKPILLITAKTKISWAMLKFMYDYRDKSPCSLICRGVAVVPLRLFTVRMLIFGKIELRLGWRIKKMNKSWQLIPCVEDNKLLTGKW